MSIKVLVTEGAKQQKKWRPYLHLALAASIVSGCSLGRNVEITTDYAVYEMRSDSIRLAFSLTNTDEFLAWLDNSRVLFEGYEMPATEKRHEISARTLGERRLFVWDIQTGEVAPYTRFPLQSSMCFSTGYISYAVNLDGRTIRMAGAFGKEIEVSPSDSTAKTEFNPFTCANYQSIDAPNARYGGYLYPLRPEDGWIERTQGDAWLHPPSGSPRRLSVPTVSPRSIYPHKYSPYSRKYLYYRPNRSRSETWAFSGSGDLQLLEFPEGPWGTGPIEPAYSSVLLRSKNVGAMSFWDPGYAGLYINTSSIRGVQQLASGNVYSMRVSNSGCLIAVFVDPWTSDDRKHRLIAFDLCKKGASHVG